MFELLSTARTRDGEAELAGWLRSGAQPEAIRARQQAVAELAPAVTLRELMAVGGDTASIVVDSSGLRDWANEEPLRGLASLRLTTYAMATAAGAAAAFLAVTGSLLPLQVVFVLQVGARRAQGHRLERMLHVAGGKARELETLSELFNHVESAALSAPRLATLRGMLSSHPASRAIRSLQRLSERHDWGHSLPLIPLALFIYGVSVAPWAIDVALVAASALLLFNPFLALAVERWRKAHGRHVGSWIAALAEFEATAALATYHFEHPQDPFPTIEADGPRPTAVFDGAGLGHPLVPLARMVRNDVRLTSGTQLLVVSGSNMSGKSTLLRTVGVNAALAFAGAPVRAASLRISPLSIGATLRIQDSLLEGRSRFFAEITRIRRLADLEGGEIQFDYRVKPGPVTKSNALALMRAVGLELEPGHER